MGSPFDSVIRRLVFDTTKDVFGYSATWTSRDGSQNFTGKVHFKNPTEEVQRLGVEYNRSDWMMEYYDGDFPGLFELVKGKNDPPEFVNIDGSEYWVREVIQVFDGGTFRASLTPKE